VDTENKRTAGKNSMIDAKAGYCKNRNSEVSISEENKKILLRSI
jgi:hypothetical protein